MRGDPGQRVHLGQLLLAVALTLLSAGSSLRAAGASDPQVPAPVGQIAQAGGGGSPPASSTDFPLGTATPSEVCGACHQAIYREFATGFGSDLQYKAMVYQSAAGPALTLPAQASGTPTLHVAAGWILAWAPPVAPGNYLVRGTLIYDLNRYNERSFTGDQTEIYQTSLSITVQRP